MAKAKKKKDNNRKMIIRFADLNESSGFLASFVKQFPQCTYMADRETVTVKAPQEFEDAIKALSSTFERRAISIY